MENKTTETLSVAIPFTGMYKSIWREVIDDVIKRHETYCEEDGEAYDGINPNTYEAEDWVYDNYPKAEEYVARFYAERFKYYMEREFGFKFSHYDFDCLWSPTCYNYEPDRIYVHMNKEDFNLILSKVNKESFIKYTMDRCKDRPGFMCHTKYTGGYLCWNLEELDDVMFSILLDFCFEQINESNQVSDEIFQDLYEDHEEAIFNILFYRNK